MGKSTGSPCHKEVITCHRRSLDRKNNTGTPIQSHTQQQQQQAFAGRKEGEVGHVSTTWIYDGVAALWQQQAE
jgi:hypothetical protein